MTSAHASSGVFAIRGIATATIVGTSSSLGEWPSGRRAVLSAVSAQDEDALGRAAEFVGPELLGYSTVGLDRGGQRAQQCGPLLGGDLVDLGRPDHDGVRPQMAGLPTQPGFTCTEQSPPDGQCRFRPVAMRGLTDSVRCRPRGRPRGRFTTYGALNRYGGLRPVARRRCRAGALRGRVPIQCAVCWRARTRAAGLVRAIAAERTPRPPLSVGEDFLLLSSAKFTPERIEVTKRVGLNLILPIAATLPFERHLRWAKMRKLPGDVAESLMNGCRGHGGPSHHRQGCPAHQRPWQGRRSGGGGADPGGELPHRTAG